MAHVEKPPSPPSKDKKWIAEGEQTREQLEESVAKLVDAYFEVGFSPTNEPGGEDIYVTAGIDDALCITLTGQETSLRGTNGEPANMQLVVKGIEQIKNKDGKIYHAPVEPGTEDKIAETIRTLKVGVVVTDAATRLDGDNAEFFHGQAKEVPDHAFTVERRKMPDGQGSVTISEDTGIKEDGKTLHPDGVERLLKKLAEKLLVHPGVGQWNQESYQKMMREDYGLELPN